MDENAKSNTEENIENALSENLTDSCAEEKAEDKKAVKSAAKAEKKQSKLDSKITELEEELASTKDLLLRTAAEFDNFKKREAAAKEKLSLYIKGELLTALLPALDNINRAVDAPCQGEDYAKGVTMTFKGLLEALTATGLEEINPLGEEFDANFHMAVMKVEDDEVGENVVTEVMQCGYKLGENVLRPAMVKVANC